MEKGGKFIEGLILGGKVEDYELILGTHEENHHPPRGVDPGLLSYRAVDHGDRKPVDLLALVEQC